MKPKTPALTRMLAFSASLVLAGWLGSAGAQTGKPESSNIDKTLSPYFFVRSDDPDTDKLPLKSTQAEVKIAGIIADVKVKQVYKNEGKNTLEAIYVFPASTRAAVYAMRMTVGERVIDAEIMERLKARKTYEQAKQHGQTASLLEQQRPNVFQMNVANILPGDEIQVELKYTELIEPEDSIYEFVYPAVVGPRYSTTPAAGAPDTEKWVENPYLHSGQPAPYAFGLSLDIQTGIPIAHLGSPSHEIEVEYKGKAQAHVDIEKDGKAGTKDFVLRYKLSGGRIQTGALLYPGRDENFFLLMMEPPERVENEAVVSREYIFIVDVSGSMNGFPLNVAKSLMENVIQGLRPNDLMNVLLFAGGSAVMSEGRSLPATAANKNKAISWLKSQHGGGGTNILPALKRALGLPRTEGISRIVVVVTDGYVNVEPQTFELIRKELGQANLFAFGIGSSVNRHIIEGMARVGRGEPFVVLNQGEAHGKAAKFRRYIQSPVLTDIHISFEGLRVHEVEPLSVPDLFAKRPLVVFGKYKGEPQGRIVIEGKTASGDFRKAMPINLQSASADNAALRLLWARHRIMRLSDLNMLRKEDRRVKEVTELGLKYSLMTQYTSFVAVDKVKRADGEIVTVKQPLPLPDGVSDLAVGRPAAVVGKAKRYMSQALPEAGPMEDAAEEEGDYSSTIPGSLVRDESRREIYKKGDTSIFVEEVRGDLDRGALIQALRSQLENLKLCCPKVAGTGSTGHGEFVYRLVINPDGTVKRVKLVMSTIKDGSTIECLKKALQAIQLPPTRQGSAEITIKLVCGPSR